MVEEWKDIKGYEGLYQVSNQGRIKSLERIVIKKNKIGIKVKKMIRKIATSKKGYGHVVLYKFGKRKSKTVHRLVAQAFIDNPENKPQINHKDSNKLNNNISNLEWCTNRENIIHYYNHRREQNE